MSIWYHHTTPERAKQIIKFGLIPNSNINKTNPDGEWFIENSYEQGRPIFISKDKNFKEPGDVTLAVEIDDEKLLPDFPSLVDFGAHVDEIGSDDIVFWWEDWPSQLGNAISEFEYDDGISVHDRRYDQYLIDLTGTAATFEPIAPSQIKLVKESNLILEFNRSDLQTIIGDANSFTIAYEIELEEISKERNISIDRKHDDILAALERGDYTDDEIEDFYTSFEDEYDEYDFIGNDPDMNQSNEYFPFTEDEIHEKFYKFFNKWGNDIYIKPDITLKKGFEIVPRTYFDSIDESFDFIDDFFNDYYNQDRFELNDNTGWHINIGYKNKNLSNLNLLKGAVLLSDEFATKNFTQRMKSQYAQPIRDLVLGSIKDAYDYDVSGENLMAQVFRKNLDKIENVGNDFLRTAGATKEFGFSPRKGYVEFRYPGGKLTPQQIKESTLYYCYIIKAVVDPEFKRKEYLKKLYKLLFGD